MTPFARLVSLARRLFPAPADGRLSRPPTGMAEHLIERIDLPDDDGSVWFVWLVRLRFVRCYDTLAEAREAYPEAVVVGMNSGANGLDREGSEQ